MQRRQLLKALAAAPVALAIPAARGERTWAAQFHDALAVNPSLIPFRTAVSERFDAVAEIAGRWPPSLRGTLYRNGPARHEIGEFRYRHWFDGDGMLQAWHLDPRGVHHRARLIATRKLVAEKAAGRALFPAFGTVPPRPSPVANVNAVNSGNISVLHHHGRLLALWEAGAPWAMEPDNLATRGLYSFSEQTEGVAFSAHPRVEPDGTLWNFGYVSGAKLLVLWHIDAAGRLVKFGTVSADPIGMPHDFVVTDRHIVIPVPPLHFAAGHARAPTSFLDAHVWRPQEATRVLIVDKNDFTRFRWLELPAQWIFHYGNAYEDRQGVIRFDGARAPDASVMFDALRNVMRGSMPESPASHHHLYRIDTRTDTVSSTPLLGSHLSTEFPCIDPRVSCRAYRQVVMLTSDAARPASHGWFSHVSALDLRSGDLASYRYPDHVMPEEHLYIGDPAKAPESGGWVVGTAIDYARRRHLLNVFRAQALEDGPIATATLPHALPMGLHAKFVAA